MPRKYYEYEEDFREDLIKPLLNDEQIKARMYFDGEKKKNSIQEELKALPSIFLFGFGLFQTTKYDPYHEERINCPGGSLVQSKK